MKPSAASTYQIDERGLELRRTYMGMTAAELKLLGGMQSWAGRNADAIGAKLAEHTFGHASAGQFLGRLRERQGHARRRPPARLGRSPGRPLQGDLQRGGEAAAASASPTSRRCWAWARCTAGSTCR